MKLKLLGVYLTRSGDFKGTVISLSCSVKIMAQCYPVLIKLEHVSGRQKPSFHYYTEQGWWDICWCRKRCPLSLDLIKRTP